MATCINLKEQFGQTFRVGTDPSYQAETGSTTNSCSDAWLFILRGARGHVCPWGGELLAVCLDEGHPGLCNRLIRKPWVRRELSQVGDEGCNAVFHVRDIRKAAEYASLYRRPQYSPEVLEQKRQSAKQARQALDSERQNAFVAV